jgi:7,8-dihydroneopterin aldolase/epimerase/oxygenase
MDKNLVIELNKLHFFSHHGLYPEEKKTGNEFEVNLSVEFKPGEKAVDQLGQTVNYEELYELVRSEMNRSRQLLETVIMQIAEKIHQAFPQIIKIRIGITKLHLPVEKFEGKVSAIFTASY